MRVFLYCPDDQVEITRVLSAPDGVSAATASTREVIVRLADRSPQILDGFIEMETSAAGKPPLKVHVVRYGRPRDGTRVDQPIEERDPRCYRLE